MPPAATPAPSEADVEREALDWFVRQREGLTARENEAFQAWLQASPTHSQALDRWRSDWDFLDHLPATELARLRQGAGSVPTAPPAAWRKHRPPARRTAMAALALSFTGMAWLAWHQWPSPVLYGQEFRSARGQQLDVQLPDGSHLRLDTASRAELAFRKQRRELRLHEGQVFLRVSADPDRPFVVLAGRLQVTVVGTRFAVRHTPGVPGGQGTRVTVEEGRVRVTRLAENGTPEAHTTVELGAGQEVVDDLAGQLGPVRDVPLADIADWRDNRLRFHDTPLAQVLAEFDRYAPTRMRVPDPAVAALRLTGTFDANRFDRFANALPHALPVRLIPRDGVTEIVSSASAPR